MITCPSCGKENPEGFRFCGFCTVSLEAGTRRSEERRIVTVLFCELVEPPARVDDVAPGDVRASHSPYQWMLRREIERFGGTVAGFDRDEVVAVFGAPVAHQNDEERAVRAGHRILEAIPEINEVHGLDLAARIRIDNGEVAVTPEAGPERGEGSVPIDAADTASRLRGVAPAGGIVVGEPTYRATERIFGFEPYRLEGEAGPVPLWLLTEARGRFGVEVEFPKSPFIGREDELALLQHAFARAVRGASVQLVTIVGEPGVGKSRLVQEFFSYIDDRPEFVYWRQGRCLPYGGGITLWALREIVEALVGILESDSIHEAKANLTSSLETFITEEGERDWFYARLAPLVGLGSPGQAAPTQAAPAQTARPAQGVPAQTATPERPEREEREESFAAWRRYLEAVAARHPLVMVLEDLHLADQLLLDFAEHLLERGTRGPILVLATARPELYDRNPGWAAGRGNSISMSLPPLSDSETEELVTGLLAMAALPTETHELLLNRAGGNPLYAEELVRMLAETGGLDDRGRLSRDSSATKLPSTVEALIAARLDSLSMERRSLLEDAAVIGKVFWSGAVEAMTGVDEAEVRRGLHELSIKELIRPARSTSVKGQAEYSFWHALVRDVCYEQIPPAKRVAKHRAAAEWIERMARGRLADHAELLAFHYTQALDLAGAAGNDREAVRLRDPAQRFLALAGERAMDLDRVRARDLLRRARGLASPAD